MTLTRVGAATGVLFTAGTVLGNDLYNRGDAAGDSATTALDNLRRTHTALNHTGLALEVLGFLAFAFFAGYLYRVLRRGEGSDGWLAGVALVAAGADLGVKLGSGAALVAANSHPALLTAELARTLVDLNNGAFVVTGLTMATFVLASCASALGTRALPRTLAWIGLVLGVLGVLTPILGFTDPDGYNPLPYLLSVLWIGAVGIARIVAETRGRSTHPSPEPAPVGH